jgi:hypothetical protein
MEKLKNSLKFSYGVAIKRANLVLILTIRPQTRSKTDLKYSSCLVAVVSM